MFKLLLCATICVSYCYAMKNSLRNNMKKWKAVAKAQSFISRVQKSITRGTGMPIPQPFDETVVTALALSALDSINKLRGSAAVHSLHAHQHWQAQTV